MPDYSFIARGLPPIDIASPLMQVEQIRQQRAAQAMRQQSLDLDQQAMGMRMADFANQREQQALQLDEGKKREILKGALGIYSQNPAALSEEQVASLRQGIDEFMPGYGGSLSPETAAGFARQFGAQVAPGPIQLQDFGGGYKGLTQDGSIVPGSVRTPPAPERPQQYKPELIEQPVAGGMYQRFEWSPGAGLTPVGEPYKQAGQVSPAQKAVDNKYATDYLEWVQSGEPDAAKSLNELESVVAQLERGDPITGGFTGAMPKWARDFVNQPSADAQDLVEQTVQRSLRAILGAQFTEKEGARLIERAYNPRLAPGVNAVRVGRLLSMLRAAYNNKEAARQYYEANGTLQGFTGRASYTPIDFEVNDSGTSSGPSSRGRNPIMDEADRIIGGG